MDQVLYRRLQRIDAAAHLVHPCSYLCIHIIKPALELRHHRIHPINQLVRR